MMRILMLAAYCLITLFSFGQSVNEKITLQLIQPPLLRVNAGGDLNLSESGSAIIGKSLFVSGGTPEFSYCWRDEQMMEYFEQSPEVFSSGKYIVTVSDQNNCSALDSLSVNDYGTGITMHDAEIDILVRLDLQNELLLIEMPQTSGMVQINIWSVEGRVIYSFHQGLTNPPFIHALGVSTFKSGIYFIYAGNELGHTVHKIVVP
jgi:hypothetical protein